MKRIAVALAVLLTLAGSTYREAVRIARPQVIRIRTREVLQ
jgi:hypothetical protein